MFLKDHCGILMVSNSKRAYEAGGRTIKKLSKTYDPSAMISLHFRNYDLAVKTNEEGDPVLVFLGKLRADGTIKGDRFARRLLKTKMKT